MPGCARRGEFKIAAAFQVAPAFSDRLFWCPFEFNPQGADFARVGWLSRSEVVARSRPETSIRGFRQQFESRAHAR